MFAEQHSHRLCWHICPWMCLLVRTGRCEACMCPPLPCVSPGLPQPSTAAPVSASPPTPVAISHAKSGCEQLLLWPQMHTLITGETQCIFRTPVTGIFLSWAKCLFKYLSHFCGGFSPFSSTRVVLLTLPHQALCRCYVSHTPSCARLRLLCLMVS